MNNAIENNKQQAPPRLQEKTAHLRLIAKINNVRGLKNVKQSTYIISSKDNRRTNFPHIHFMANRQIQVGDEYRHFYCINIPEERDHDGEDEDEDDEPFQVLNPFQYFPKKLISEIELKNSSLGRMVYLMKCVSSPLFIHRKNDIIKMSIDFKPHEVKTILYKHFYKKDFLGVMENTESEGHVSLIDLRSLKILNHEVIEDMEDEDLVSCFLAGNTRGNLFCVDNRGCIYRQKQRLFIPKLNGEWNFFGEKLVIFRKIKFFEIFHIFSLFGLLNYFF